MNMYMIRICMDVCVGNDTVALVRGPPVLQVVYMRNVCDMNMYIMYMIRMCMGVCVAGCMCTCKIYIYTYICVCIHIYICTYTHLQMKATCNRDTQR